MALNCSEHCLANSKCCAWSSPTGTWVALILLASSMHRGKIQEVCTHRGECLRPAILGMKTVLVWDLPLRFSTQVLNPDLALLICSEYYQQLSLTYLMSPLPGANLPLCHARKISHRSRTTQNPHQLCVRRHLQFCQHQADLIREYGCSTADW